MTGHTYEILLATGVAVPLVWFAVLVFFGRRMGKPASGWFAVSGVAISCLLSAIVLIGWNGLEGTDRAKLTAGAARLTWAVMGDMPLTVGVKLDSLTVIMYFMVSFVSLCIFVFSVGYMAGHSDEVDKRSLYHRFFTYLCLFEFSMLGLVVASSLLFLFIFWELVGVCSYFLIGFYFDRKYASDAAIKAFVTNRVGDFGFLVGMMMVVFFLGTLDLDRAAVTFELGAHKAGVAPAATSAFTTGWLDAQPAEVAEAVRQQAAKAAELFRSPFTLFGLGLASLMGVALFCGAMGKSAQFPLQVWLPDAMAGPTPVSALIHAATMVAAGVYLVARIFRLLTPDAQLVVAGIGCITLTITALIAIVQTDIKKVLAYSTLSQLGYMIFGMGVGAWIAALFHLMTHAFFKALLFLGSGQVIEGCHHEQDIRNMGGLRKKMPVTCWTFFIGVIAIAGVGIPAVGIGVGGYFSKDEILAVAYERTFQWSEAPRHEGVHASLAAHEVQPAQESPSPKSSIAAVARRLPLWLFCCPIAIAYITPFYMLRVWWLTFMGKPRNEHVYHHAHESKLMYVPLIALAVGTFFSSYFLFRPLIADAAATATDSAMVVALDGHGEHVAPSMLAVSHATHSRLVPIVGLAFLAGFAVAYLIYRNGLAIARAIAGLPLVRYVYVALVEKLFFDHVYDFVLVKGTTRVLAGLSRWFDGGFDRSGSLYGVIDRVFNLAAATVARTAFFTRDWLDVAGVDGAVNGLAASTESLGDMVRRPQTGRVRTYILLAAGTATVVVLCIVFSQEIRSFVSG